MDRLITLSLTPALTQTLTPDPDPHQVMTFDTWTDGMFGLMRAASGYAWIYFVTIAFLGGLFVVNLFLCVIFDEFMKSQARATRTLPHNPSS